MRLVLSGGGTGGHVYPALAVAQAMRRDITPGEELDILYVGAGGQETDIVSRAGFPMKVVSAAPIRGRMPWQMAANAGKIGLGVNQARRILREFNPNVVLSTGGYASFPVAMAARTRGIPLALYLPDLDPGWAVRTIARLARKVAVSAIESLRFVPSSKSLVTGYPVRDEFWNVDRAGGRERLGLDPEEKVIFITGASSGAHIMNQAVAADLTGLLQLGEVIHLCGQRDEPWLAEIRDSLPGPMRKRYHLHGYMYDEIPWAMAAADLCISRAGASVLGELPAVGTPAILVPGTFAGGHQRHNARYLERAGAAAVLEDSALAELLPMVGQLLHDDARLRSMREASRRLARPNAAARIAKILFDLAKEPAA
jgi:UDP-N-acetylglucosamine--N-acetylmuramyl-(pentapeptide) pyrophosphoryl-undecaprenol N-acetylglucosamine transferase